MERTTTRLHVRSHSHCLRVAIHPSLLDISIALDLGLVGEKRFWIKRRGEIPFYIKSSVPLSPHSCHRLQTAIFCSLRSFCNFFYWRLTTEKKVTIFYWSGPSVVGVCVSVPRNKRAPSLLWTEQGQFYQSILIIYPVTMMTNLWIWSLVLTRANHINA